MPFDIGQISELDANKSYYLGKDNQIKEATVFTKISLWLGIGGARTRVNNLINAVSHALNREAGINANKQITEIENFKRDIGNSAITGQALQMIAHNFRSAHANEISMQQSKMQSITASDKRNTGASEDDRIVNRSQFVDKMTMNLDKSSPQAEIIRNGFRELAQIGIQKIRSSHPGSATHEIKSLVTNLSSTLERIAKLNNFKPEDFTKDYFNILAEKLYDQGNFKFNNGISDQEVQALLPPDTLQAREEIANDLQAAELKKANERSACKQQIMDSFAAKLPNASAQLKTAVAKLTDNFFKTYESDQDQSYVKLSAHLTQFFDKLPQLCNFDLTELSADYLDYLSDKLTRDPHTPLTADTFKAEVDANTYMLPAEFNVARVTETLKDLQSKITDIYNDALKDHLTNLAGKDKNYMPGLDPDKIEADASGNKNIYTRLDQSSLSADNQKNLNTLVNLCLDSSQLVKEPELIEQRATQVKNLFEVLINHGYVNFSVNNFMKLQEVLLKDGSLISSEDLTAMINNHELDLPDGKPNYMQA
ncbi:MAG: hypothetical protein K6F05_08890 [Succinivibrio sp.]|nr:hypothetical protein [Succinivibrio sp.]